MTVLYAQPYDISAQGFYFEDENDYTAKVANVRNDFGQPVEEFEIQFIDGDAIDVDLAKAWSINQANACRFLEVVDEWDSDQKSRFIIAVGECGYDFDVNSVDPDDYEIDIYHMDSLRELAEHFVDEGLFGPIPEPLAYYINYDAIARDLAVEYSETDIAGQRLIYACR